MPVMGTLTDYLRDNNITQGAFAARAGLSQSLISRLCKGTVKPTVDRAALIERLTDGAVPMSAWVQPPGCASEGRALDVGHPTTPDAAGPSPCGDSVNAEGGA